VAAAANKFGDDLSDDPCDVEIAAGSFCELFLVQFILGNFTSVLSAHEMVASFLLGSVLMACSQWEPRPVNGITPVP
jgi:hypothetical protein